MLKIITVFKTVICHLFCINISYCTEVMSTNDLLKICHKSVSNGLYLVTFLDKVTASYAYA